MRALELINYLIPPLRPADPIAKAMQWLDELRVSEIPITVDENFLGFVNDEIIYSNDREKQLIEEIELVGSGCVASANDHFYEILKIASRENCKSVAIVNDNQQYLGVVTMEDVVSALSKTSSVESEGAILVISTQSRDYYLSEICRMVEAADAKVLGAHLVSDISDPSKLELTLKINKSETSYVISNLEQNGYKVIQSFSESAGTAHEQERIDQLLNFLKI